MKSFFQRTLILIFISITLILAIGCSSPENKKQAFLDKGNHLFDQKDFVKAKLEYKNAIQIDSNFAKAYHKLAMAEFELKNFKQAYGLLLKAVELNPDNIDARLVLGKLLLGGKAIDKADEQADAILQIDKSNIEGSLLKASVHIVKKEIDKSKKILMDLYNSGVLLPDMFMMLSSLAKMEQDSDKMQAFLKEGLEKNPDNIRLILTLAQIEAGRKNYDVVEKYLQKAIDLKPEQISLKLNLAKIFLVQGKKDKAALILNQALVEQGSSAKKEKNQAEKIRINIANLWIGAKEIGKAESIINDGLVKDPDSFTYRLFLAQIYANTKRLDKSEMLLRQALDLNPDPANPEIIKTKLALAKLLLTRAKIEEGELLVDEVILNDPKNVDAHFLKGKLYLSKKDGINAVSEFRVVAEDRPNVAAGHLNLAQAHVVNKENDLAMDVLKNAYLKIPDSAVLLKAMARLNVLQNDMGAAEANLKKAVDINPSNLQPFADLGDFYLAQKKYKKALEQYNIIIKKKPDLSKGYIKTASIYLIQEKYQKAVNELKKGYKKIPDSALLVTSLAKLYIKGKQYDAAVKLCKDRLKKSDKEAFTWNLLGSIYLAKKELGQAQTAFEKAVKIMPEWGKPYDNLARIYLVKGEKQEAIAEFKAALEKNPKNRAAWMILGSIYEKDSEYDKAALIYEEAFENNPGLWAAANNYAFIKAETSTSADELQKAMEFARKADQLKPGAGVILDTLGWIYFKMGDMDKAYENILAAVDQHPDYDMLNYHMGMVLDRQGKISEAKIYLEKSLNSGNDFLGIEIVKQLLNKYKTNN